MILGKAGAVVALLAGASVLHAAQTIQTQNFGPSNVSFPALTTFNQYPGAIGTLNYALVEVFVTDLNSSMTGTNQGVTVANGTYAFGVNGVATSSVFPGNVTATSSTGGAYSLAPNGFAGDSFADTSDAIEGSNSYVALTVPTKTPFVGGGSFNVNVAVAAFAGFSGDAIFLQNVPGQASGRVVVTYDYVPEPASMAMLGLGGLALLRRRRR